MDVDVAKCVLHYVTFINENISLSFDLLLYNFFASTVFEAPKVPFFLKKNLRVSRGEVKNSIFCQYFL